MASIHMTPKEQEHCSPTKLVRLPCLDQSQAWFKSKPACKSRRLSRSSLRIQLQPEQLEASSSSPFPNLLSSRNAEEPKRASSVARLPSVSKPAPPACMKVGSRAARHRMALQDSIVPCQHTQSVLQRVIQTPEEKHTVTRLVSAEARRHHERRSSFQERSKVLRVLTDAKGHEITEPTIWQLSQCREILREAVEDIRYGVRIVRKALKNSKLQRLLLSKLPELKAMAAISSHLTQNRDADAQWMEILDSVRTPRGAGCCLA
eukprot:TRINITY_DN33014_c0_g1_i1.p1 TRINITY_DN33014_c0_g1~~TRINITY_DN33014_c0_g1_i1.p1  ORF type:complete len:304 (+),score=45.04 TRINITY_DN33014_c0_g1_i1:127-912(+)